MTQTKPVKRGRKTDLELQALMRIYGVTRVTIRAWQASPYAEPWNAKKMASYCIGFCDRTSDHLMSLLGSGDARIAELQRKLNRARRKLGIA